MSETIPTASRHTCLIFRQTIFGLLLAAVCGTVWGADVAFEIPPVPASLNIAGQPVTITISGSVSEPPARQGASEQSLNLNLRANLTDFQSHITPLLQAELNQSNRCGERISVESARLMPAAPAGRLTVQLHFEKWVCLKAFGKQNAKRLVAGDGSVEMLLTPKVGEGNAVRLDAEIGKIEADGTLGDLLRSGSGPMLRDKIRDALLKAIQKTTSLDAVVPAQARPFVTIQAVDFAEQGTGLLMLNLRALIEVPREQISAVLDQLRNRR